MEAIPSAVVLKEALVEEAAKINSKYTYHGVCVTEDTHLSMLRVSTPHFQLDLDVTSEWFVVSSEFLCGSSEVLSSLRPVSACWKVRDLLLEALPTDRVPDDGVAELLVLTELFEGVCAAYMASEEE